MKNIFKKDKTFSIVLSVVLSFLFVFVGVNAATTISTNITTGGTLNVTGATTLSSTLGVTGATTLSSTLAVTGTSTFSDTATMGAGKGLVLGSSSSNLTGSAGMIFYDSTNKAIKLYDGANWFTVGTTTNGVTLSGDRVQLSDLTTQYMTFGTTTQQGLSLMTLQASTTTAIPLSILGYLGQSADFLDVMNSAGTKLVYVDSNGALITSGSVTLGDAVADVITVNGYLTQGRIGTGSTFAHIGTVSADELGVEGDVEIDGTAWFDGVLHASSTALIGGSITHYGNLTFDKAATTTVSFLQKGLNFDSNTFVIDPNSNRVGVGTSSPATILDTFSSATTTITIDTDSTSKGGCLKIRDIDGAGYSYCTTLNGAMTCSTLSCE